MPVVFIEAPPGSRRMRAENVAMNGGLQSENPKILEALGKVSAVT